MSKSPEPYREAFRRLHRTTANYLAMVAWCQGADCIVMQCGIMRGMFNTERFQDERVDWLEEDMRPWFPRIQVLRYRGGPTVYLSRVPINLRRDRALHDFDRVKLMREDGLKVIHMYSGLDRSVTESEMLTQLTLMAAGLQEPTFNEKGINYQCREVVQQSIGST